MHKHYCNDCESHWDCDIPVCSIPEAYYLTCDCCNDYNNAQYEEPEECRYCHYEVDDCHCPPDPMDLYHYRMENE